MYVYANVCAVYTDYEYQCLPFQNCFGTAVKEDKAESVYQSKLMF